MAMIFFVGLLYNSMMNEDEKLASRRRASKKHYQKTKGAAQKRYKERNKEKVAADQKERKERYKQEGRCTVCGKKPLASETMCQKCCERNLNHYYSRKQMVYEHYGAICNCCGTTQEEFLTIDHINDDGAEHRKTLPSSGTGGTIYSYLIENNFPEDDFQILCWNCQWGKKKNGVCPHQDPSSDSYLGEKNDKRVTPVG